MKTLLISLMLVLSFGANSEEKEKNIVDIEVKKTVKDNAEHIDVNHVIVRITQQHECIITVKLDKRMPPSFLKNILKSQREKCFKVTPPLPKKKKKKELNL